MSPERSSSLCPLRPVHTHTGKKHSHKRKQKRKSKWFIQSRQNICDDFSEQLHGSLHHGLQITEEICLVHAVFQHLFEAVLYCCDILMVGHTVPGIIGFQNLHRHLAVQLYTSLSPRRVRDFHPLERAHGAQTKNTLPAFTSRVD